jgi:lysophospholipase L1-like esterase
MKIKYVDLHKYFLEKDVFSLRENREDYYHPSKLGHEIAAKAIYEYLLENYFMPLRNGQPAKPKNEPRELK